MNTSKDFIRLKTSIDLGLYDIFQNRKLFGGVGIGYEYGFLLNSMILDFSVFYHRLDLTGQNINKFGFYYGIKITPSAIFIDRAPHNKFFGELYRKNKVIKNKG